MGELENSGCAHLLVSCATDATVVIFHFLFSSSAHARPQNCCARPLGYFPQPCYAYFPKSAEISATNLKMRNGCVTATLRPGVDVSYPTKRSDAKTYY